MTGPLGSAGPQLIRFQQGFFQITLILEVIATRTLPWAVGPTYSVGLGVVQGDDWQAADQRLPIQVESSQQVVRLFDGDTWARLIHVEETLRDSDLPFRRLGRREC